MCAAQESDSDTEVPDGGRTKQHRKKNYGSVSSLSLLSAMPKSNGKLILLMTEIMLRSNT